VILKKPIFIFTILSLLLIFVLAVPQSALATPSYCPLGMTRVAYYNWDGDSYEYEDGAIGPIIEFRNATAQGGEWHVINPPYDILIYKVIITDGDASLTRTYDYPLGTYGWEPFAINWVPPHDISNIAFCVPNTPVTLAGFTARANRGIVTIDWVTATEIDTAGFLVYRSTTANGSQVQVNANLIAAKGNEVNGASYRVTDTPGYGTFYYWLEDVDYSGQSALHGPVVVKVLPAIRQPVVRPSLPSQ